MFRKYVFWQAVFIGGALATIAAFNLAADPFEVFGVVRSERIARCREYEARVAKVEQFLQTKPERVLLGSSRIEVGFDPQQAYPGEESVYNYGLSGTSLQEISLHLNSIIERESTKKVLLGLDFYNFNDLAGTTEKSALSRFAPNYRPVEYYLQNLLGWYATKFSLRMVKNSVDPSDSFGRRDGLRAYREPLAPNRNKIEIELKEGFMANPVIQQTFRYTGKATELLREAAVRCRERNVELELVILPVHAVRLEGERAAGAWPTREQWIRDLTVVVDETNALPLPGPKIVLWDFTGFSGRVAERLPARDEVSRWYRETSHFRPELGNLVAAVLAGKTELDGESLAGFGVRLNGENVEAHLQNIRAQRQQWVRTNTADAELIWSLYEQVVERPVAPVDWELRDREPDEQERWAKRDRGSNR